MDHLALAFAYCVAVLAVTLALLNWRGPDDGNPA